MTEQDLSQAYAIAKTKIEYLEKQVEKLLDTCDTLRERTAAQGADIKSHDAWLQRLEVRNDK